MVAPYEKDLNRFIPDASGPIDDPVELIMGELDQLRLEGAPFKKISTQKNVVTSLLDDNVHCLGEGFFEGITPVLGYGEGDPAADVCIGENCKLHPFSLFLFPLGNILRYGVQSILRENDICRDDIPGDT